MFFKLFNSYLRPSVLLLGLTEAAVIYGAVCVGVAVRVHRHLPPFGEAVMWPKAAVATVIVFVSLLALGLYQFHQRLYFKDALARLGVAFVLASFPLAVIWYLLPGIALARTAAEFAVIIALGGLAIVRLYFMRTVDENIFRRRTLVYGTGSTAAAIHDIRRRADRRGFRLVGNVTPPGEGSILAEAKCMQHDRPLLDLALERRASEIVVAMDDRRGALPMNELLACKMRGIDVLDLVGFMERETEKIRIDLVNPSWIIFSSGFRIDVVRRCVKRLLDLTVSSLALLLAWPFMLMIALAIKVEDGSSAPVIYRQRRVGLRNRTFRVLKFRSMIEAAEADGQARWAEKNDCRITRVGRFLRKLRLDELPQLINVLRGEMSLVGPRPERPEFVGELKETIPYYCERHAVKPGITGWAQLKYQYGSTDQDAIEKLQYDLYYVKNHNLLLDLVIILQTAEVMLWGKGSR